MLRVVLFDFGGVLAEEGFREGLKAIAKRKGLDPEDFYKISADLVYQTGYITGGCDEHSYWNALRKKTGLKGDDREFREEILKRFKLRPEMTTVVRKLKSSGFIVAILSDQTNWLDELDQRTPFHHHFDYVFNSFHLKKTKRDPSIFRDVCDLLGVRPKEILFVDDNLENVKRATRQGLRAIHFKSAREFRTEINTFVEMR
ncbi:MAG TPA: HAD family phosphatase [Thermodesulfobacteriota bacterium]|nr:HAD family phosphatase [Thermodesulfobacteriota bacterium]